MTNITKAAQTSTEPWSFWEALPGHLIDKYEGATLTEELLQEAAASLHAKLRAEQPARQEPCSGPLCGLPEFGEHHPLCNLHLRAALQDKAGEVQKMDTETLRSLVADLALEIDPDADLERYPEALGFQIDMARAVMRSAQPAPVVPDDAECLNWIEHQHLEDLGMGLVIDAPNDGQYYVCGDSGTTHYGKTLRDAIKGAIASQQKGGSAG